MESQDCPLLFTHKRTRKRKHLNEKKYDREVDTDASYFRTAYYFLGRTGICIPLDSRGVSSCSGAENPPQVSNQREPRLVHMGAVPTKQGPYHGAGRAKVGEFPVRVLQGSVGRETGIHVHRGGDVTVTGRQVVTQVSVNLSSEWTAIQYTLTSRTA